MRRDCYLGLVAAAILIVEVCVGQEPELERLDVVGQQFATQLTELADECEQQGQTELAERLRHWYVPRFSGRQVVFTLVPETKSGEPRSALEERFGALRERRAELLWSACQEAAAAGRMDEAYQGLFEILREAPTHPEATRLAGKSATARQDVRVAKGRARHKRLAWPAGKYWRADSPHFSVSTNLNAQAAEHVAGLLERHHQLWRQLFVRYWTSEHALRKAFAGGSPPRPSRRRHHVVLFADREQFVRHLKPLEPQIDLALGVYRDKDRTTYLYYGKPDLHSTWFHEITHQLFQETTSARHEVAVHDHFWIVEGIAMYMESARWQDNYFIVGGFESPRLQVARFRLRSEGYYLPLEELNGLGKSQLQLHPDIRRLYTQSAGMAHFFMDGKNGRYRQKFIAAVADLYRRPRQSESLPSRLAVEPHRLDDQYGQFLDVTDADLLELPHVAGVRQLVLGHTQVTDDGLHALREADSLEWLDLASLPITDRGLEALPDSRSLRRLNLEGTRITDASLAHVGQFEALEELDLSAVRITDTGLSGLMPLRKLKVLWLSNTATSADGIRQLAALPGLQQLDITGTRVTRQEWSALRQQIPSLTHAKFP